MPAHVDRKTVDLSAYPDLVVIYLGMRVRTLAGVKRLLGLGPQIEKAGGARPDGLLHFENNIIFSLFPLHLGMRWYWRDLPLWNAGRAQSHIGGGGKSPAQLRWHRFLARDLFHAGRNGSHLRRPERAATWPSGVRA